MAARTSAHPGHGDDLEIEIIEADIEATPGDRSTVEAVAAETPLTVWIDDLRETVEDVLAPARKASEITGLAAGSYLHRLGVRRKQRISDRNPRRQSRVRLHLFIPYAAACTRIPGIGVVAQTRMGRLALDAPFEPHRAGLRAPATLVLRGSWPGLPVWIDIEPWWREQTIVSMSLRSTTRLRYPRRYFSGSYRLLRRFVSTLART
ncbi:MAG: hypothetical protein P8J50_03965 [Acidimicrobiales bacterium]|jgi:hypothetical protein|nr:hypothetical protein [Acidimicrobiales bacterium]